MGNGIVLADAPGTGRQRLPASARPRVGDAAVRVALVTCGAFVVATTLAMLAFLAHAGVRGLREAGVGQLLGGDVWKPEADLYGGLPLIVGTFASALGAIAIGAAPAVLSAV